jgi:hypothetical protein
LVQASAGGELRGEDADEPLESPDEHELSGVAEACTVRRLFWITRGGDPVDEVPALVSPSPSEGSDGDARLELDFALDALAFLHFFEPALRGFAEATCAVD